MDWARLSRRTLADFRVRVRREHRDEVARLTRDAYYGIDLAQRQDTTVIVVTETVTHPLPVPESSPQDGSVDVLEPIRRVEL